ncbi:metallophosphoesterase [Paenibacillus sp. BSR1-1]|uniref:metallophosphoesterase n=1 Tax=Paenibacillus sp. BSR1-1 TaxID=3020845 RepID=UPI0025AFC305|nr:metallophosphoesterase [Paenibacillus sp. BSR1-1]MDN3019003.1 metallophosphoesterase [Paenibacillus sp. BSR1-1]
MHLILLFLFSLLTCAIPLNSANADELPPSNEPLLQFPVISDIHIGNDLQKDLFTKALSDLRKVAPDYQAIVMVGDITNNGTEQDYDNFNLILNSNINPSAEKVISMGNHEYFEGVFSGGEWNKDDYINRFVDKTGMPGLYYDSWINGYHFITLGGEGFPSQYDHDHANISDEQFRWLERTLAKGANLAQPIFVFLHQAIDHTVYGSDDWGAGFKDSRLMEILKRYPQAILFSGHSHYLLNHPRTIYQDGFTMVNTGSVAYAFSDFGAHRLSQGLLVKVYPDRVEIKAREFTDHTWIQSFTVPIPFQKTYEDEEKPFFAESSAVRVEKNINGDSVTLSWDAAIDNTLVDRYLIKHNGKVIYTKYMKFWETGTPEAKVTLEIPKLTPETAYNLEITAVDAWKNESETGLSVSFNTPKLFGWKLEEGKWHFYKEGLLVTGWQIIDGKWYFFSTDGYMATGWITSGNKKYYLNADGAMQIGWKEIDGKFYYFNIDGSVRVGWLLDRGNWYYLKSEGMVTGWLLDKNNWYYFSDLGMMKKGWIQVTGKWYYFESSGAMKTGWVQLNEKWYFLDIEGVMKTGWLLFKDDWYYLQSNGAMKTGWLNETGKWYFFKADGTMAKNTKIQRYVFDKNGVWIK